MSPLLISLSAGALIGLVYALLKVQSPAPPAVALVGLLGMVIGSTLGDVVLNNEAADAAATTEQHPAAANPRPVASLSLTKQAE